jgi:hypothetical protein
VLAVADSFQGMTAIQGGNSTVVRFIGKSSVLGFMWGTTGFVTSGPMPILSPRKIKTYFRVDNRLG